MAASRWPEGAFGTIKARMGATHFLIKNAPKGGCRDGPLGPGLQSDSGFEHLAAIMA
jgi:hypothetical protein